MSKHLIFRWAISRVAIFAASITIFSSTALAFGDFGAIAFSPSTHGHGYVFGFASRESAQQAAINQCENYAQSGDCMSVVTTEKNCAALAVGAFAYGSAMGTNSSTAQDSALRNCQSAGSRDNCRIVRWLCH